MADPFEDPRWSPGNLPPHRSRDCAPQARRVATGSPGAATATRAELDFERARSLDGKIMSTAALDARHAERDAAQAMRRPPNSMTTPGSPSPLRGAPSLSGRIDPLPRSTRDLVAESTTQDSRASSRSIRSTWTSRPAKTTPSRAADAGAGRSTGRLRRADGTLLPNKVSSTTSTRPSFPPAPSCTPSSPTRTACSGPACSCACSGLPGAPALLLPERAIREQQGAPRAARDREDIVEDVRGGLGAAGGGLQRSVRASAPANRS